MNNNFKKTLTGALATMSMMSIATPVMAQSLNIDTLYKNAYEATIKAQETETQTDINAAMDLIWQLRNIGNEKQDENLINAACTWSSLVDKVQHPKLVKIVEAITKAQETGRQADINAAFTTIEDSLPDTWKPSYTSAIDIVQQKLQGELVSAVETAENDRTKESVDAARVLVNEVLTAKNEAMVKWATIFEDRINNITLKEEAFVEAVKSAKDANELKTVLTEEAYKDLVTYNENRIADYFNELSSVESLKEVKDIQDVIDAVNTKIDKEEEIAASKKQYLQSLMEASKNEDQEQFNQLLNETVKLGYIEDVKPEYMEKYKERIKYKVENNWIGKLENIQKCINEINQENLQ